MSKERELLARVLTSELWSVQEELQAEIKELLAEPAPEPVAWKDRSYGNLHHTNYGNSIPLYTAPKREPLSDEAICEVLLKKEWFGFVELVRIIEKMHGIGEIK